jgi:hypothetical protein
LSLPIRYATTLGGGEDRVNATVILDREQVIVQRLSPMGTPLILRIPYSAFDGIAVRMSATDQTDGIEVMVELMHRDPALSLPLMIADDPAEVVADWQVWGETLDLPLLIVEQDGTIVMPTDQPNPTILQTPQPRRRHSYFAKRRPRFLTRRKTGRPNQLERLDAREIIARD